MTGHRWSAGLIALVLLAAACSSQAADDSSSGGGGGDDGSGDAASDGGTPIDGITDDTINVSFIGADFAALAEAGLAPDLGDMTVTIPALVDDINENGGIGGRQINLTLDLVDGTAGPDVGRAACIKATEEDDAAVVFVSPAISRDIVRCTSVQQQTITIGMPGWDDRLYEESEGRLFSVGSQTSMGTYRNTAVWADVLDQAGELEGKTIGVVTSDDFEALAAGTEQALVPHLEELGYEVVEFAVLPCPEGDTDCEQHEPTMQTFKDAGVDLVFMNAGALAGPALFAAATSLDYHPQWVTCCNSITDTVVQFAAGSFDQLDGTFGVSTTFAQRSEEAETCNQIVRDRTDEDYATESDAYGFTGVNCIALLVFRDAMDTIDGPVTEAALIEAIEGLETVPSLEGIPGTIGPDKHDAGDAVFLAQFTTEAGEYLPVDDEEPIEAPA
ncbi:MAG TPA: ABC transporter substrate-binding protein [Acidimicrobiales bacterium]